ncbi:NADase-type glycan-binding domain-containing protein [Paenibacillus sp. MMS18-CY102]|uniref:NADase-type glycan-binding domain-containing protein n=1 Tax=Paenibacillus sp. MMS18-CY102 TaxID=2682849 RepID=UPI001365F1B5|nr:hypothetical protein [Paenibacillus sp. MMS18-CY102]MWC27118.1 hypothetical protein [Paenibacillus sp. MMS18-CY102]
MKLQSIAKYMLVLILISLSLMPSLQKEANAAGTSAASFASYEGKWVDQALVEDENTDNDLILSFDKTGTRANVELDMSQIDPHNYYAFNIAKRPAVTFNTKGEGTFSYEMIDLEDEDSKPLKGTGTILLKNNQVKLTLSNVFAGMKPYFKTTRTMIRDPYAYRSYTIVAAETILSDYCKCSPGNGIKFSYPGSDNDDNKPWVKHLAIYVNGSMMEEYKINLHKRTATKLPEESWYYTDYSFNDQFLKADKNITASSTLPATKTVDYSVKQLVDGNLKTCWCEGIKGDGVGQSITVAFPNKMTVTSLSIASGYTKSLSSFLDNGMVRKASIAFSNGTSITVDLTKGSNIKLADYGLNSISTSSIKLTILEVRPGAKFHDTCISEISAS